MRLSDVSRRGRTLCVGIGLLARPADAGTEPRDTLLVLDVGHGLALIFDDGAGGRAAVDSGPYGEAASVLRGLSILPPAPISLWVHTHFDADHIGGLGPTLAGLDRVPGTDDDVWVTWYWDRGLDAPLPDTAVMLAYEAATQGRRSVPGAYERRRVGTMEIEAGAPGHDASGENARGRSLCVQMVSMRVFIPGDLPAQRALDDARRCGPVDVLVAGHHGSADGTSSAMLEALDPALVVVSAGTNAGYCLPDPGLARLIPDVPIVVTGAAGLGGDDCPRLEDDPAWPGRIRVVSRGVRVSAGLRISTLPP